MIPQHASSHQIVPMVNLGVMLRGSGRQLKHDDWRNDIGAYFLCIDYTDCTELDKALKKGYPWFLSKVQDGFLKLSDIVPVESVDDPHQLELELKVNNKVSQHDNT